MFPRVFCFPKSPINKNGDNRVKLYLCNRLLYKGLLNKLGFHNVAIGHIDGACYINCQQASQVETRGWRGGSIIKPCA